MRPLITIFLFILTISIGNQAAAQSPVIIEDPDINFSYELPKGWVNKDDPYYHYIYPKRSTSKIQPAISLTYFDGGCPVLKDCFEGMVYGQLRAKLQNFKVKSRGNTFINESEAYWATYTYNDTASKKPIAATALIYMFVKVNHRFIITATVSTESFAKYEPHFKEIIHSINASNQ